MRHGVGALCKGVKIIPQRGLAPLPVAINAPQRCVVPLHWHGSNIHVRAEAVRFRFLREGAARCGAPLLIGRATQYFTKLGRNLLCSPAWATVGDCPAARRNARRRRAIGLRARVRGLVDQVLADLPRPLTPDVTDDVLRAIEANVEWRRRFDEFCVESARGTICPEVGYAVAQSLNRPTHISRC